MDIEIEVSYLAQATNRMQGALSETSLPYVSMLASDSSLQFSATDRSVAVFSATHCEVRESGEVAVPARLLCSIARQLPPGRIRLQKQRTSLQLSSLEMELQMRQIFHAQLQIHRSIMLFSDTLICRRTSQPFQPPQSAAVLRRQFQDQLLSAASLRVQPAPIPIQPKLAPRCATPCET